jgi:excisionase family DNA binding protein
MLLLTVREAALQTKMSTAWWRTRIFRREIQFVKLGRRVLIPQLAVDELLSRSVVEPKNKPKTES